MIVATVNRHRVAKNRKTGSNDPVLRVSRGRYGQARYTSRLEFNGKGRLIYDVNNPLPCGATCWMEIDDADPVAQACFGR